MSRPTAREMRRWFPRGFENRTMSSDYHLEFGDRVVCYKGTPMWTMIDVRSSYKLLSHLRGLERRLGDKDA